MYTRREIFTKSPLELVAVEVRYPYSPRLRQPDLQDRLQIALEKRVPFRRQVQSVRLELSLGGQSTQQMENVFALFNSDSTVSVRITPESTLVETTSYLEFPKFLEIVEDVLTAVAAESAVPAIERIGLRYLDEIRVPGKIEDAKDWGAWVDSSLVAAANLREGAVHNLQGVIQYKTGAETQLQFTFAALTGTGVVGDGPLKRRKNYPRGPFFLLDFDSFWLASSPEMVRRFDAGDISEMLRSLHCPMGEVFQGSIKDSLRKVFRGE